MIDLAGILELSAAIVIAGTALILALWKLNQTVKGVGVQVKDVAHKVDDRSINGWLRTLVMSEKNPCWVKRVEFEHDSRHPTEFIFMYGNAAFEKAFGITNGEYEGKRDEQVWEIKTAQTFRRSDLIALGSPYESVEIVEVVGSMLDHRDASIIGKTIEVQKKVLQKGEVKAIIGQCRPVPKQRKPDEPNKA